MIAEVSQFASQSVHTRYQDPKGGGSDKIDAAVVRAFKRADFDHVTPRADVMTFNRWVSEGYRPREGEKSVKAKRWRLFHSRSFGPY
jgi:hypothetical protein